MLMYGQAETELTLPVAPRRESWDAAVHPSQRALTTFLGTTAELVLPIMERAPEPLALRLEVGLARTTDLLDHRDLDNYLLPLARHLTRSSGRTFASVSGSKRHASVSRIGIGPATPIDLPTNLSVWSGRTSASTGTRAYKQQIREGLVAVTELPAGPVRLEITFTVGPSRSWLNLWKPTIDALGPLLGEDAAGREWHPRDGRITELGLHRVLDHEIAHDVGLAIAAGTLPDRR